MTPCNGSHENNSSEPSRRTLHRAFTKNVSVVKKRGINFENARMQCLLLVGYSMLSESWLKIILRWQAQRLADPQLAKNYL